MKRAQAELGGGACVHEWVDLELAGVRAQVHPLRVFEIDKAGNGDDPKGNSEHS